MYTGIFLKMQKKCLFLTLHCPKMTEKPPVCHENCNLNLIPQTNRLTEIILL